MEYVKSKVKKIIAITGPICSGKSTIIKAMKHIVPIFSVDKLQKQLYEPEHKLFNLVQQKYSHFIQEGKVNKNIIRKALINDKEFKLKYQKEVVSIITLELEAMIKKHEGLLLVEIPYINSEKLKNLFDKFIIVNAPKEIRLKRLIARNSISPQEALSWIDSKVNNVDLDNVKKIKNDGSISIEKIVEEVYTCLIF